MRGRWILVTCLTLSMGCVYYNGMYRAQRLANQAEKAQRDGRSFDAQSYWAQAEVKADSVISRHPTSSWVDDALIIKSRALIVQGACADAIPHLERVRFSSTDHELVEQAGLYLAECYAEIGDSESVASFALPVVSSADQERSLQARILYGKALNGMGEYQEALEVLSDIDDPAFDGDRAIAFAGAGNLEAALKLADSLIVRHDTLVVWDTVLAVVARQDPDSASKLTDKLAASDDTRPEDRAHYLLLDGVRWLPADQDRSVARFQQAAADSTARINASRARIEWARLELSNATSVAELPEVLTLLAGAAASGGLEALVARQLTATIQMVQSTVDSLTPQSPNGDLEMFLLAETARDTLLAPELARSLFHRLTMEWPDSPYAPKALLAMAALKKANSDLYRLYLVYGYYDSPYLSFVVGEPTAAFVSLEDSLEAYSFSRTGPQGPAQQRGPGRQRRGRTDVDDLDEQDLP